MIRELEFESKKGLEFDKRKRIMDIIESPT